MNSLGYCFGLFEDILGAFSLRAEENHESPEPGDQTTHPIFRRSNARIQGSVVHPYIGRLSVFVLAFVCWVSGCLQGNLNIKAHFHTILFVLTRSWEKMESKLDADVPTPSPVTTDLASIQNDCVGSKICPLRQFTSFQAAVISRKHMRYRQETRKIRTHPRLTCDINRH
jgi:hypothetical protein